MTSRQEAKLNMYNAVVTYCQANNAIVASVPAFQTAFNDFQDIFSSILETAQLESQNITGVAMDKTQLRTTVVESTINVAAAVYAYAISTNNNTLKERVNYSLTELSHLKDELLGPTCMDISQAANDNIANLAPYNITAAVLTDLNANIGQYMLSVSGPRNAVTQRATYKTTIKNLFKDGDNILKNQMDKIALQFKTTNLEFYTTYFNNRIILDAGTSATQAEGIITQSGTETTISGVAVQVVGQSYSATSDGSGNYKVKIPIPGTFSIKFSKSGFADKTIDNVEITLGQSTSLDVQLDAA
jgi:hypothetical protein